MQTQKKIHNGTQGENHQKQFWQWQRNSCKKFLSKKEFHTLINEKFNKVEKKIAVAKVDILKFYIKASVAQISLMLTFIFALLDFYIKK